MRIVLLSALFLAGCGSGSWISGHWTIDGAREGDSLDLYEIDGKVSGTYAWSVFSGSVGGAVGHLDEPLEGPTNAVRLALENRLGGSTIMITARATNGDRHLVGTQTGASISLSPPPAPDPGSPFTCSVENPCGDPSTGGSGTFPFEATKN
jgi:hypothetical protein